MGSPTSARHASCAVAGLRVPASHAFAGRARRIAYGPAIASSMRTSASPTSTIVQNSPVDIDW
jgi:hypothetical protein